MLTNLDVEAIVKLWRNKADVLREHGALPQATTIDVLVADLEQRSTATDSARLTLSEAQAESGYSVGHLGRMVRSGAVPNAGRKNAPRIRRSDLANVAKGPRSQPNSTARTNLTPTREQIARAVVNRQEGGAR